MINGTAENPTEGCDGESDVNFGFLIQSGQVEVGHLGAIQPESVRVASSRLVVDDTFLVLLRLHNIYVCAWRFRDLQFMM